MRQQVDGLGNRPGFGPQLASLAQQVVVWIDNQQAGVIRGIIIQRQRLPRMSLASASGKHVGLAKRRIPAPRACRFLGIIWRIWPPCEIKSCESLSCAFERAWSPTPSLTEPCDRRRAIWVEPADWHFVGRCARS